MTADHGNAEQMVTINSEPHTAHTNLPLDFVNDRPFKLRSEIIDIAPTMLKLLGIEKPQEMTGQPLITDDDKYNIGLPEVLQGGFSALEPITI